MNFLQALEQTANTAYTENGALSNSSTLDSVLDFFSRAGAMRENKENAVLLFEKAFIQDPSMAIKALFYMRDIRGGQGERDLFRACVKVLPNEIQKKIITYVPEYGRWDDLFSFTCEISSFVKNQLEKDEQDMKDSKKISLLAKWLPSENTSSKETQEQAKKLQKDLGLKPKEYRKRIVALRKYIGILENKMSSKLWQDVDYEKIPSQAHRKHTKAFKRNDENRYGKYLEAVEKGEKKIKTSTLYTYEVFDLLESGETEVANLMWENLPDFTRGVNALVVADVSGSMSGRPLSISVSLALYFAERNKGMFQNHFITFSESPKLVRILGESLQNRTNFIENADWGQNTDIEKVFKVILDAAILGEAKKEELPSVLYIISDMEFDSCVTGSQTNYQNAKKMFEDAGYVLPHVVFWNVSSRNDQSPATKYDDRVTLISGSSQSTFRYAVEGKSPLELMQEVLHSDRYSQIEI